VSKSGRPLLRICAIGCGLVFLLGALFAGGFTWSVLRVNREALARRESLDRQYPGPDRYTPPADGTIPEERMRRFLAVRRELAASCPSVAEHWRRMEAMNELAESEDSSPRELFGQVGRVARDFPRLPKDYGGYVAARNRALLQQGMGLGEYTWIYAVSYFGALGDRPARAIPASKQPDPFRERVIPQLRQMMARRLAAARRGETQPDSLAAWRAELDALARDGRRLPFQDGLPPELAASIEPFRAELEALACPEASELDLTRTVRRGLWYDHR
jgi:hypothetical protein